ncbi:MAG: hypothetical protein C5B51_13315 [Terriglobia bacterium]|nr:MAG: hypothetical protein C5B51_13315 [Terriglobia bacterium]
MVIWLSGIGAVMALLGLIVGVWLYSPVARRYRFPSGVSSVPYAGQKRWHTILGLLFGLVTCTWAFSGMLSLSPFEWLSGRRANASLPAALHSPRVPIGAFTEAPHILPGAKEVEFAALAGTPVYLETIAGRPEVISIDGRRHTGLDPVLVRRIAGQVVAPYRVEEFRIVRNYEAYYLDRHHERPLPVIFIRLNDPERSMYYVDPRTGRTAQSYAGSSRINRWLYHGLHSLDLPWLYTHRPAWDLIVLSLMAGGTALCVTSMVIAWRRLRHKLRMFRMRRTMVKAAA